MAQTDVSTAIRVVSLVRDTERRAGFSQRAAATKLRWSYFDAHAAIAPELRYDPHDAIVARGRVLSTGELGCYSSHYALWREFLASAHDQVLILEDDTMVDWRFIETLVRCDLERAGLHYLRLFSKAVAKPVLIGRCLDRYLFEYLGYSLGSQAYMLTRAGARHLVAHLQRVRSPIDDTLDKAWRGSLPSYALFPYPVIELAGDSRIGVERHAPSQVTWQLHARRLWYRLEDRALRRAYQIRRRLGAGRRRMTLAALSHSQAVAIEPTNSSQPVHVVPHD